MCSAVRCGPLLFARSSDKAHSCVCHCLNAADLPYSGVLWQLDLTEFAVELSHLRPLMKFSYLMGGVTTAVGGILFSQSAWHASLFSSVDRHFSPLSIAGETLLDSIVHHIAVQPSVKPCSTPVSIDGKVLQWQPDIAPGASKFLLHTVASAWSAHAGLQLSSFVIWNNHQIKKL